MHATINSPSIIEIKEWAHSPLERPISLFKSHEKPAKPILLIGGVHGDEPEGVWLAECALEWLSRAGGTGASSRVDHNALSIVPWMVIPCLNPDGAAKNERVNGNGVDLNRNYPAKSWSPKFEKDRYNPGPHPASEPEVKALVSLIQTTKPRLLIHCHSWKAAVVYAGPEELPAAQALAEVSGYPLQNDIGYPTPGSLSEWGWFDNKIPVICIEECEGTMQKDIWPRFGQGLQKIFSSPEWWS